MEVAIYRNHTSFRAAHDSVRGESEKVKTKLILGGPGCGKTTRLLQVVEEELARGVEPNQIAFVAFTKAASEEAQKRAAEAFSLNSKEDLPWFRTIHSLAYQKLGMSRDEILNRDDWKEFGKLVGWTVSGVKEWDGPNTFGNMGDRLLRVVDYASTTMMTLEEAFHEVGEGISMWDVRYFDSALRSYKTSISKMDFTDLLLSYAQEGEPLKIRVAIIDEAQDLTMAQWKAVHRAFANAERLYIGGDDDQAIYRWAGAAIDYFLSISREPEILHLSHRLPQRVFALASNVSSRISHRYSKPFRPTNREGEVIRHQSLEDIPLRDVEGTWMLLARNGYMLSSLQAVCFDLGIPYATREGSAAKEEEVRGIALWDKLRKMDWELKLKAEELRLLRSLCSLPRPSLRELQEYTPREFLPVGQSWYTAFDEIPLSRREFYVRCLTRGESLTKAPRVKVETIHGVKGAEADHVAVLPDLSRRTSESFEAEPDAEHRVFYVAVTRARESLHLVSASGPNFMTYSI
jgi:superfamily I DNA/RNA helicase